MAEGTNYLPPLGNLERWAGKHLTPQGFRPRGSFAERHGSWEIAYIKTEGDTEVHRLVSLAVTRADTETHWFEVWIMVDSRDHFRRERVFNEQIREDELGSSDFEGRLKEQLDRATDAARTLKPDRVKDKYPHTKAEGATVSSAEKQGEGRAHAGSGSS